MEFHFAIKILIYLGIAGMSMILIYHFMAYGKKSFPLYSFVALQLLIFLWAFHDMILETNRILRLVTGLENYYLGQVYHKLEFFVTCFIPYTWLIFSISYSDVKVRFKKILLTILLIPPGFFYFLHFTRYFTIVNLSEIGLRKALFLIYMMICYSYLILGTVFMIRHVLGQTGYSKKQAILLSSCMSLPFVSSIIQNVRIQLLRQEYEVFDIDITLVSFAFTMLFIAIATFKFRFLKTVPYAMRELFCSMDQPVIVLDKDNNILEYNRSFIISFSDLSIPKPNKNIGIVTRQLREKMESTSESEEIIQAMEAYEGPVFTGEITFTAPVRSYSVNIRPVFINRTDYAGKVIVFNDITGLKNMIEELNEKNTELLAMNEQLIEYSAAVEDLAVERERNRLARDVHDTLGQSMTIINTLLNASLISCEKDVAATKEKLTAAMAIVRNGLAELRRVVRGLLPEKFSPDNLLESLKSLVKDFEASGLHVELNMDECERLITNEQSNFLYRLCQEALTNSVRHGKAKNVMIIIQVNNQILRVFISDDGLGTKPMTKGMGLTGMERRAGELGGSIRYWHGEERGFNIYIELPLSSIGKQGGVEVDQSNNCG